MVGVVKILRNAGVPEQCLTRSLITLSVFLSSRLAAERFCRSLPVEVLRLYAFNSSRPLPRFKSKEAWKESGKREGRTSPVEGEMI